MILDFISLMTGVILGYAFIKMMFVEYALISATIQTARFLKDVGIGTGFEFWVISLSIIFFFAIFSLASLAYIPYFIYRILLVLPTVPTKHVVFMILAVVWLIFLLGIDTDKIQGGEL